MGVGGSIPFIAEFAAAFPSAKILVTGVEDPATQAHSINESLHLGVLERAATAEALLLANLGSDGQVAAQLGDVPGGLDVVLRHRDLALLVDDERRADDALNGLAVHRLLAEGAPRGEHLAVRVGQQREGQFLVVAELGELGRLVGGDADDVEPGVVELGEVVAKVAGLLGAARASTRPGRSTR